MTSPDAAAIADPSGSGGADADQRTVRPFRLNDSVRFLKSYKTGPRDSSHWTPRTMSYDPRDNP
jgi:hypothetical protein